MAKLQSLSFEPPGGWVKASIDDSITRGLLDLLLFFEPSVGTQSRK